MITILTNHIITGARGRQLVYDVFLPEQSNTAPVLLFCHGYKGFKDWGAWNMMARLVAGAGVTCIKFNYSHNGGTVEQPIDFPDLEAFGNNNYSLEVEDTTRMLDWIEHCELPINKNHIVIMGHSRGGGIATLVTARDQRIKGLITLASVSDYETRFPKGKVLDDWKTNGVMFVENGRTKQQMPLYYQFYEDFIKHKEQFHILNAAANVQVPFLIIHGDADTTVSVNDACALAASHRNHKLYIIKEADHVLGASHPWHRTFLPEHMQRALQCSLNFISQIR